MAGLAYYNEIDPYAAEWLRNLIAAGLITAGDVDTRSIVDVRPSDLEGYERCHFFAGIGVWDYALNLAGWPAGRPVWTGSCPCQPFSAAGRQAGFADERHLWPAWFDRIRECRPDDILGEQVEAAVRLGWLDAVFSDLEGQGYACGAVVLAAHSVGAPHIRQRLWFVADAGGERRDGQPARLRRPAAGGRISADHAEAAGRGETGDLADAPGEGWRHTEDTGAGRGHPGALQGGGQGQPRLREPQRGRSASILGDTECERLRGQGRGPDAGAPRGVPHPDRQRQWLRDEPRPAGGSGFWADADWIACRDGKARPVEPGTFPLAHGPPARVGRLRAYGNAINAEAAAAFIGAVIDTLTPSSGPIPHGKRDGGGL